MLAPDTPQPTGGGVRAYHFAKAVAEVGDLHLVVLIEEDNREIPSDLRSACASILQPPRGFRASIARGHGQSRFRNVVRALGSIAMPWAGGGRELLEAGARNCLSRAEKATNDGWEPGISCKTRGEPLSAFRRPVAGFLAFTGIPRMLVSAPHRLYAAALQAEITLGTRSFGLPPARTMERSHEFSALLPQVAARFKSDDIDVVWIEHSYLFPFVRQLRGLFPKAALVCNAHNVEYSLHERLGQIVRTGRARRWYAIQSEACRRMERRGYAECALTFCCSDVDRDLILSLAPNAVVETIPNGVDTEFFRKGGAESPEPTVLFTGGMGYAPNQDAVRYFTRDILPLIRREKPGCRFYIAGAGAKAQFADLAAADPLIEIASDVPDMRPYFDKAWVVVVPLRAGSGTRIKILEAMAMSKPVVTTSIGAEGIPLRGDHGPSIADEPSQFAARVVRLIEDAHLRRSVAGTGRELVVRRFDWHRLRSSGVGKFQKHVVHGGENCPPRQSSKA